MAEQVSSLKTGVKYKDTPIGKIPIDWEAVRLGDICRVIGGSTPSTNKREYWNGEIPFATPTDITNLKGREISDTKQRITLEGLSSCGTNLLPVGTILLTSRATIGAYAINTKPMATNQGFASLVCNERAYNWFIFYKISSLIPELQRLGSGSTFKEVSKMSIRSLIFALPPISEQKKIAEILGTIDEAIEKTDEVIEKTKEVKKGLMQRLLTRGIAHKKFKKTEIGEIPVEWEIGPFSKIADINPKRDLERGTIYPFVEMAAIDSESHRVHFSEPRKYEGSGTRFQNRDTLFGRITPCTENGKTAYVDFLKENKFGHGSTEFIILGPKKNVDPKFIYYCAKWDKVRNIAVSKMEGTSGRQRVPIRVFLEDIFIPIPTFPEQQQIAEILSFVDEEIEGESNHKDQLESLKKGLMQVLLTGKIRVSV